MIVFTLCFVLIGLLFSADSNIKSIKYNIDGMSCQKCVNRCGNSIKDIEGINSYQVDLQRGMITVHYDPQKVTPLQIKIALETTPFKISDVKLNPQKTVESTSFFNKFLNIFQSK